MGTHSHTHIRRHIALIHSEYRPADPTMWEVHEGELYLAHGQRELVSGALATAQRGMHMSVSAPRVCEYAMQEVWRADRSGFITEGNRFWAAQGWAN